MGISNLLLHRGFSGRINFPIRAARDCGELVQVAVTENIEINSRVFGFVWISARRNPIYFSPRSMRIHVVTVLFEMRRHAGEVGKAGFLLGPEPRAL